MNRFREFFLVAIITSVFAFPVGAADPPVKKGKNDICHPKSGTHYKKTKNYKPYRSMEECIKSGGRKPKK